MNGVATLRQLLIAHAPLIAVVPAVRIRAGVQAAGTPLPLISLTRVSEVDRNILEPVATRHVEERVQVTIISRDYPALLEVERLVKQAAADKMPTVTGIVGVVVHSLGGGPDFMDEAAVLYIRTHDFRVSFTETR